jgi:hypothetical protein
MLYIPFVATIIEHGMHHKIEGGLMKFNGNMSKLVVKMANLYTEKMVRYQAQI